MTTEFLFWFIVFVKVFLILKQTRKNRSTLTHELFCWFQKICYLKCEQRQVYPYLSCLSTFSFYLTEIRYDIRSAWLWQHSAGMMFLRFCENILQSTEEVAESVEDCCCGQANNLSGGLEILLIWFNPKAPIPLFTRESHNRVSDPSDSVSNHLTLFAYHQLWQACCNLFASSFTVAMELGFLYFDKCYMLSTSHSH
jgi:hypothetical protein